MTQLLVGFKEVGNSYVTKTNNKCPTPLPWKQSLDLWEAAGDPCGFFQPPKNEEEKWLSYIGCQRSWKFFSWTTSRLKN